MNLLDKVKSTDENNNIKGVFSIKSYHKDGTIDEYEDNNLIMDAARNNMARLIGGYNADFNINKFVIGTRGHIGGDILGYKKVGREDTESSTTEEGYLKMFDSRRPTLFSLDGLNDDVDDKHKSYAYGITFDVKNNNINYEDTNAVGNVVRDSDPEGNTDESICSVRREINERSCTFTITIPESAGQNSDEGAPTLAYTEAALYMNDQMFSMKTFPARLKEETVKLVISWSIIF